MFIKIISVQYFTMFSLSLIDTYILPPPPPSSSSFELNVAKAGGNQKIKLYWFGGGGGVVLFLSVLKLTPLSLQFVYFSMTQMLKLVSEKW